MKSERGNGDMKWKGRKAEFARGHSVLFLMRWSSDISALRGCLSTGRITASGNQITSCSSASHGRMQTSWRWSMYLHINQIKEKDHRDVQENLIMICVLYLCGWGAMSLCVIVVGDLFSLPHTSWWEVTWQTVPCDLSWDGHRAQRIPFKCKRKLTFTHLLDTKVAPAKVTQ